VAEVATHPHGTFCFVEAGSFDVPASRGFFVALFGWEAEGRPVSDEVAYTRFLKRGRPVAGMYRLEDDPQAPAVPSGWLPYVSVADTRGVLDKAIVSGASPLGDVVDVPGVAVVAEFVDPTGAVCGVWQSQGHSGSAYLGEAGSLMRSELATDDSHVADGFYREVFDWTHEAFLTPEGEYFVFREGDESRAGMRPIGSASDGAASQWRAYLGTEDLEAATNSVGVLGGSVDGEAFAVASMGRAVVVRDPAGIAFALMEATTS
jgi:predicted enzyme related to lactoylglutathione lyase